MGGGVGRGLGRGCGCGCCVSFGGCGGYSRRQSRTFFLDNEPIKILLLENCRERERERE